MQINNAILFFKRAIFIKKEFHELLSFHI